MRAIEVLSTQPILYVPRCFAYFSIVNKRELVHEVLDLDQGFFRTFVSLFVNPRQVLDHPQVYTKPWKYATVVVSVACLFTWLVVHNLVDRENAELFWSMPKRLLELSSGYQVFYENTQPLKRLVVGMLAFTSALYLFLYAERHRPPGLWKTSLYLIGHAVSLAFLVQTVATAIFGDWWGNQATLIGVVTYSIYLWYATMSIFVPFHWSHIFRGLGIMVLTYLLYTGSTTRFQHWIYFDVLHRTELPFPSASADGLPYEERPTLSPITVVDAEAFTQEIRIDSLRTLIDMSHPAGKQISRITVSGFVPNAPGPLWSVVIFEKINRYSPTPRSVKAVADPVTHQLFVSYRIANDSTATLESTAIDLRNGQRRFSVQIRLPADDVQLQGVAVDSAHFYLCGSTLYQRGNYTLGLLAKVDRQSGEVVSLKQLGQASFASYTSFDQLQVTGQHLTVNVGRE